MVIHARNFVTSDDALGGSVIQRSVRFNTTDQTLIEKTSLGTSPTSRRIATISIWFKRSRLQNSGLIGMGYGGAGASAAGFAFRFKGSYHQLGIENQVNNSLVWDIKPTRSFRDVTSWYHVVAAIDTTQSTSSNRVKVYVNGEQETDLETASYPSQNYDNLFNYNKIKIGSWDDNGSYYNGFSGYVADFYSIDGQQLDASYFGYTDSQTGLWRPKRYEGTFGNYGVHLDFSDNSSTSNLGLDRSGNSINFSVNNFSVSSGAGNDSLEDTPTNNFCILNPLAAIASGNVTLSNGNLDASFGTVSGGGGVVGTFAVSSGKWYWETTITAASGSARITIGVVDDTFATYSGTVFYEPGLTSASYGYVNSGTKYNNNTDTSYGASYTTNDVIGVALDLDKGTITFYKNNSSQGQAFSGLTGGFLPAIGDGSSAATHSTVSNFGQRAFAYTPPSGFKALSTKNLPPNVPSIIRPQKHFENLLYTGTDASAARTIDDLEFAPGLIWQKRRNGTNWNTLHDTVRGAGKTLYSNSTSAEATNNQYGYISAFGTNGFTWSPGSTNNSDGNETSGTFVSWCWKAGGASVSNTDGSITSSVSANQEGGFSIVSWTGTNGTGTIGHGLGKAPQWIVIRRRDSDSNWVVYHEGIGNTKRVILDENYDASSASANWFNNTSPTSTTFSVGSDGGSNGSTDGYIAYCWTSIPRYSKIGTYQANGNSDGPYVDCGFRPAWILIKNTSLGQPWVLMDDKINPHNLADTRLSPSSNAAEYTGGDNYVDILSNGFKIRSGSSSDTNYSTTYPNHIFIAFAEQSGTTTFDTFPNAR